MINIVGIFMGLLLLMLFLFLDLDTEKKREEVIALQEQLNEKIKQSYKEFK